MGQRETPNHFAARHAVCQQRKSTCLSSHSVSFLNLVSVPQNFCVLSYHFQALAPYVIL